MRVTKLMTTLAAGLLAGLFATPASAAWESVNRTGACSGGGHNQSAVMRAIDRRSLLLPAGFRGEMEVYGQGLDLVPDVGVSGIANATARRTGGTGGLANLARGCGSIGSIIVNLILPNTLGSVAGTLNIGGERITVTVVPQLVRNARWSLGHLASPPPPVRPPSSGTSPCDLPGNTSNCFVSPGPGGNGSDGWPTTVNQCVGDLDGGSATIDSAGTTMTIALPPHRGAAGDLAPGNNRICLNRPIVATFESAPPNVDSFAPTPGDPGFDVRSFGAVIAGGDGLNTVLPVPAIPGRAAQTTFTPTFLDTFTGSRTFTVSLGPASGAQNLTLKINTTPSNGVLSVTAPAFPKGRTSSTMTFRVQLRNLVVRTTTTVPGIGVVISETQPVVWRIVSNGPVSAQTCFAATLATANAAAGTTLLDVPVTAIEAPACNNQRFTLTASTLQGGGFLSGAPLDASAQLTFVPKSP